MSRYEKWRELSDEVLQSIYKPRAVDYVCRCPKCGKEVCRCGAVSTTDVKAGMDRIILIGTIVDADKPIEIDTKYGRTLLTRAFLQDPSGRVRLNLWGEHAPKGISGSIVRIENAFASKFPAEVEVNLGWRGAILLVKSPDELAILEHDLSYSFHKKDLLLQALTRSSFANEQHQQNPNVKLRSNEQLAFLGDAVIDLVVSEYLYSKKFEASKGELTDSWQSTASRPQCANAGRELGLHRYLRISEGERPLAQSETIMGETYEAVIGAVFLDGLYEKASVVVKKTLIARSLRNHDKEK
jgi:23S rRNA maturation mini-RNase III